MSGIGDGRRLAGSALRRSARKPPSDRRRADGGRSRSRARDRRDRGRRGRLAALRDADAGRGAGAGERGPLGRAKGRSTSISSATTCPAAPTSRPGGPCFGLIIEELGVGPGGEGPLRRPFDAAMCAAVEDIRPALVSFHFGLPDEALLGRVRGSGARMLSQRDHDRRGALAGGARSRCGDRPGLGGGRPCRPLPGRRSR